MKQKMNSKLGRTILFIAILYVIIMYINRVFIPINPFCEFYKMEEDEIQVLALGTSQVNVGFSPMELYDEYGITSCNLATRGQSIELSYCILEEVLKHQKPEVVVLDVSAFTYNDEEEKGFQSFYRDFMDVMPMSTTKVKTAWLYSQFDENRIPSMMGALFPLYYYHTTWNELKAENFDFQKEKSMFYSMGQGVYNVVAPFQKYDMSYQGLIKMQKAKIKGNLYPHIEQQNMIYLERIYQLCQDKGISLVCVKLPNAYWSDIDATIVSEWCQEHNVEFVDENVVSDVKFDSTTDTADGIHVNLRGAKKTTKYLGEFLKAKYNLKKGRSDKFDRNLEIYREIDYMCDMQMETDFEEYLQLLNERKENLVISFTSKRDIVGGLSNKEIGLLHQLGLQADFSEKSANMLYGAVVDEGKVLYENMGNEPLQYTCEISEGDTIEILSDVNSSQYISQIKFNEKEKAVAGNGLSIVVYDKKAKMLIDSVNFNTSNPDVTTCARDSMMELDFLNNYQEWVCEKRNK